MLAVGIYNYPGSLFFDMTFQIGQYYGVYGLQVHPPFSTLVMGKLFGSDCLGLFSYVILQSMVCLVACVFSIVTLRRMKLGMKIEFVAALFYGFFPLFGASAQCGQKDTINYGITLLALTFLVNIFLSLENDKFYKAELFGYAVSAFFGCLWRKEMIYVYVLSTAFVIIWAICKKGERRKVWYGLLLIPILLAKPIQDKLIAEVYFGQKFYSVESEAYSIPLQMIARVVTYDDSNLSAKDKEIIGECFVYGYDEIKNNYNPNLSDPIKYNFDLEKSRENGFWKVFQKIAKENTKMCIESIIASAYGYFYIGDNVPITVNNAPTNGLPGGRVPSCYIERGPDKDYNLINVSFNEKFEKLREDLYNWMKAFEVPYNFLYSFGFYSWFILFLAVRRIIRYGVKEIIPFTIALALIAACIASPVNDCGRYYMGVIYMTPLIIGVSSRKINVCL